MSLISNLISPALHVASLSLSSVFYLASHLILIFVSNLHHIHIRETFVQLRVDAVSERHTEL